MNLFPIIQAESEEIETDLKLYKEVKWDYEKNIPALVNGAPEVVTGKEAVLVWAWKAIHTNRYRHEIYSWDYGNEVESLIGQPFSDDLKQAEAARYVRDCLLINPYITGVNNISVKFSDDILSLVCTLSTVYGEVELSA